MDFITINIVRLFVTPQIKAFSAKKRNSSVLVIIYYIIIIMYVFDVQDCTGVLWLVSFVWENLLNKK